MQPQRVFIAIIGCNLWKSGVHMAATKKSGNARNAPVIKPKKQSDSSVGHEWIKKRLKEVGKTPTDLSNLMDITAPRVSEKLSGRVGFNQGEIRILAHILEMPLHEVQARVPCKTGPLAPEGLLFVTVCGAAKAGHWMKAIEIAKTDYGVVLVPKDAEYPYLAALRVSGDDMEEFYPIGSHIVYSPYSHYKNEIIEGTHVVVERSDGAGNREISIKEFRLSDKNDAVLLISHSKNPDYEPVVINHTDGAAEYYGTNSLKITGVVLKVLRDYKPPMPPKNARKLPKKL